MCKAPPESSLTCFYHGNPQSATQKRTLTRTQSCWCPHFTLEICTADGIQFQLCGSQSVCGTVYHRTAAQSNQDKRQSLAAPVTLLCQFGRMILYFRYLSSCLICSYKLILVTKQVQCDKIKLSLANLF